MGKIFGISDLPVTQPFPSLQFGAQNCVPKPFYTKVKNVVKKDFFVKPKTKPFSKIMYNMLLKK